MGSLEAEARGIMLPEDAEQSASLAAANMEPDGTAKPASAKAEPAEVE